MGRRSPHNRKPCCLTQCLYLRAEGGESICVGSKKGGRAVGLSAEASFSGSRRQVEHSKRILNGAEPVQILATTTCIYLII